MNFNCQEYEDLEDNIETGYPKFVKKDSEDYENPNSAKVE